MSFDPRNTPDFDSQRTQARQDLQQRLAYIDLQERIWNEARNRVNPELKSLLNNLGGIQSPNAFFTRTEPLSDSEARQVASGATSQAYPQYRCEIRSIIERGVLNGKVTLFRPDGRFDELNFNYEHGYRALVKLSLGSRVIYEGYMYYRMSCFNPARAQSEHVVADVLFLSDQTLQEHRAKLREVQQANEQEINLIESYQRDELQALNQQTLNQKTQQSIKLQKEILEQEQNNYTELKKEQDALNDLKKDIQEKKDQLEEQISNQQQRKEEIKQLVKNISPNIQLINREIKNQRDQIISKASSINKAANESSKLTKEQAELVAKAAQQAGIMLQYSQNFTDAFQSYVWKTQDVFEIQKDSAGEISEVQEKLDDLMQEFQALEELSQTVRKLQIDLQDQGFLVLKEQFDQKKEQLKKNFALRKNKFEAILDQNSDDVGELIAAITDLSLSPSTRKITMPEMRRDWKQAAKNGGSAGAYVQQIKQIMQDRYFGQDVLQRMLDKLL